MSYSRGGGWSAKNWMELVLMQLASREVCESGWDQGCGKVQVQQRPKRLPVIELLRWANDSIVTDRYNITSIWMFLGAALHRHVKGRRQWRLTAFCQTRSRSDSAPRVVDKFIKEASRPTIAGAQASPQGIIQWQINQTMGYIAAI